MQQWIFFHDATRLDNSKLPKVATANKDDS
jgi:hypothetical protein